MPAPATVTADQLPATRQPIDWPAIEADYRLGRVSLRQTARDHGITAAAILKRARRDDWTRDLQPRIQAASDRKLAIYVAAQHGKHKSVNGKHHPPERLLIDAMSDAATAAQVQQTDDISEQRKHVTALAQELASLTYDTSLRDDLTLALADQDNPQRLTAALERVCSLPGRIKQAKELSEALERLVTLERRVLRINDEPLRAVIQQDNSMSDRVSRIEALIELGRRRALERRA